MIKGIGVDIIEISRVKKAVDNDSFLKKYFTDNEIKFFATEYMNYNSLAGNFASKEAVVKALGTGFNKITPKDIEILRDEAGKPYVLLYGNADKKLKELGVKEILVSISHDKDKAISYVTLQ